MKYWLLISIPIFIGCINSDVPHTVTNNQHDDQNILDTITIGASCDTFSAVMNDLVSNLVSKKMGHGYNIVAGKSLLTFREYFDCCELKQIILVPNRNFQSVFIQSSQPIENFYPYCWISEICFSDEQSAESAFRNISAIIKKKDNYNKSVDDYILKNKDRLIYVKVGSNKMKALAFDCMNFINKKLKK